MPHSQVVEASRTPGGLSHIRPTRDTEATRLDDRTWGSAHWFLPLESISYAGLGAVLEDDEEKLYVSASYAERPIHRDDAAVRHPDADRHLVDDHPLPLWLPRATFSG